MAKYTKEDIIRLVEEEDVKFIRLQFSDIFGMLKNVAVTASQIEKVVNNQIMIDGSSIEGFVRIRRIRSVSYIPDLDSFAIMPWRPHERQGGAAAVRRCIIPTALPLWAIRRNVLKRADRCRRPARWAIPSTWVLSASFSCLKPMKRGVPTTVPQDDAGYFDLSPRRSWRNGHAGMCAWRWRQWALRSKPATMRLPQGQHEVDFKYAEAHDHRRPDR